MRTPGVGGRGVNNSRTGRKVDRNSEDIRLSLERWRPKERNQREAALTVARRAEIEADERMAKEVRVRCQPKGTSECHAPVSLESAPSHESTFGETSAPTPMDATMDDASTITTIEDEGEGPQDEGPDFEP